MAFSFPQKNNFKKELQRITALVIVSCFIFEQTGFAQVIPQIPNPAYNYPASSVDKFHPVHLRYVYFDRAARRFNVLLDKGDNKQSQQPAMEKSSRDLMTYFFTGVRLPNTSFWVNLRPDSPERIIDDALAKTDIGRIMLAADVQLKKDLAAYTSPKNKEGKEYWDKLYKKAAVLFGNEDISIPTITRPWIVPNEIILRQSDSDAYIYKATLKVLLESDYLKDSSSSQFDDGRIRILNDYSSQLIKELILPKLSKDVNISKRYAPLRQVYYSLILAQWYKSKFEAAVGQGIDISSSTSWSKETYYRQYRDSFEAGEYNVQDSVQTPNGQTIRQYFSGGIQISRLDSSTTNILTISADMAVSPARYMDHPQRAHITVRDGGFDVNLSADDIDGVQRNDGKGASSSEGLSTVEADINPAVGAPVSPGDEEINRRIRFLEALEKIINPCLSSLSNDVLKRSSESLGFLIDAGLLTTDEAYQLMDTLATGNNDSDSPGYAQNIQIMKSFIGMKARPSEKAKSESDPADKLAAGLHESNIYHLVYTSEMICAAIQSGRLGSEDIRGINMSVFKETVPFPQQKYFLKLFLELRNDKGSANRITGYFSPGMLRFARLADNSEIEAAFYGRLAQCIRDKTDPALAQKVIGKELLTGIVQEISSQDNARPEHRPLLIRFSILLGRLLALLMQDGTGIDTETLRQAFKLSTIMFKDQGSSSSNVSYIVEHFINSLSPLKLDKPLIAPPEFVSRQVPSIPEAAVSDFAAIISNAQPMILGRTMVFEVPEGKFVAFKMLKRNEDPGRLTYESEVFDYLRSLAGTGVDLQAEYPQPYFIKGERVVRIRCDDIPVFLKDRFAHEIALDTTGGYYTVMAYTTDGPGYFTYLHEMQNEALAEEASLKCIHDLFTLARYGLIHPDIIELFHNLDDGRQDNGKYFWLADLIRQMDSRSGAGRLHAWEDAVHYPNLRTTGPADLAELISFHDLRNLSNPHLSALRWHLEWSNSVKREKIILAYFQGNYMLAWALNEGKRLRQKNGLDWKDPSLLALRVRKMYSSAFRAFTGKDDTAVAELVDWDMLARQMAYFMNGDYVPDLVQHNIPEAIFGPGVEVGYSPNLESSRGWTSSGWMSDGKNADLGPVNGPLPLQELIKANYIYTMFMMGEYITDRNDAAKDGGKKPIDLNTYWSDIAAARERGAIVPMAMGGVEDEYSPVMTGLTTTNTRGLSYIGRQLFEIIMARHNGNGDAPLRVLVLGHGSGRECALIKALAQEHKKAIVVDALGLSEIAPSLRLTRSADDIMYLIKGYMKEHYDVPAGWKPMSGAVSLVTAFDMQNKGYDIFELLDTPFIRTQFIGLFHTAEIDQKYDFIYDNFGSFFYSATDRGLQETLAKTVGMLSEEGIFYAENLPDVDRLALGTFPDKLILAITSDVPNRLIVCKRGSWLERAAMGSTGITAYTGTGHEVMSIQQLLTTLDGGFFEYLARPRSYSFDKQAVVRHLIVLYPDLAHNTDILDNLADFIQARVESGLTPAKINAAMRFIFGNGTGHELVYALRRNGPEATALLRIIGEACLVVSCSRVDVIREPDRFYQDQISLIRNADFSQQIRNMSSNYRVNPALLDDIIGLNLSSLTLFQAIIHEVGHNILRASYSSGAWAYYTSGDRRKYFRQTNEFFADIVADRVLASLGLTCEGIYLLTKERIRSQRLIEYEYIHAGPRYIRERLASEHKLSSITVQALYGAMATVYPDIDSPLLPLKIISQKRGSSASKFWAVLTVLGVYEDGDKPEVNAGFKPWLDEYRHDGGTKKVAGIDLRQLSAVNSSRSGTPADRQKLLSNKDELLLGIARTLRSEEDTDTPASPACKDLLVFLESGA